MIAGSIDGPTSAWSSPDGRTWHDEPMPNATVVPTDAAAWGDATLELGLGEIGRPCAQGTGVGMFLRSAEGAWAAAPFQDLYCDWAEGSLAAGVERAIAVGITRGDSPTGIVTGDGLNWTDIHDRFVAGLPSAAIATPIGFLVFGFGSDRPWVQRSQDGLAWTDPVLLPAPGGSRPMAAAVLEGRIVVLVADGTGPMLALASTDAMTWSGERTSGLDPHSLLRAEATPFGLVVLEWEQNGTPHLFASATGTTFREVELPAGLGPESRIADWVVTSDEAILVGHVNDGDPDAAWIGPASLLAP